IVDVENCPGELHCQSICRDAIRVSLKSMNVRIGSVLLLGTLLSSVVLCAQSTPSKALLVLSKSETTLAIVDPSTLKVVARMPSVPDPHEVAASDAGKFATVSKCGRG